MAALLYIGSLLSGVILPVGPVLDTNSDLFQRFITSAGFGGCAALLAAIIAFAATYYSVRSTRRENEKTRRAHEKERHYDRREDRDRERRDRREREIVRDRDLRERLDVRELDRKVTERSAQWERFVWVTERAIDPKTAEWGLAGLLQLLRAGWIDEVDNQIAEAVADGIVGAEDTEAVVIDAHEGEDG
ncbi:hypothetical protein [Clavibacter nebraskensis]|uniref:hypothetical protein n=1 Tax=Clavibacter nebraskensis TaxID=31963 RepID=UPI00200E2D4C|nr:hypothetical protein [Clavibacter nebraskensis]UQB17874.1 hypothetical protein LIX22_002945 [Clavibacter nebraskensis]